MKTYHVYWMYETSHFNSFYKAVEFAYATMEFLKCDVSIDVQFGSSLEEIFFIPYEG